MYILHQENGSNIFYICQDRQYTIGRKNTDFMLLDDQSISRKHAIITLVKGVLCLQDCNSKYGTLHQEKKLLPEKQVQLEHNQIIKFGVFQSIFTVKKMKIVTTSSALSNPDKINLKKTFANFGGTLLDNWSSECTHLTAKEIMLTVKVLLALMDEKPIVTLEYWDKFSTSIQNGGSLPNPKDYKPPLAETFLSTNVTFKPDKRRQFLFQNKIFVFPTKKLLSRMEDLIKRAGGKAFSWDQQQVTLDKVTENLDKYIFIIDGIKPTPPGSLKNFHEKLAEIGQRTVPVREIVLAVLMLSIEEDCNPHFNRLGPVFGGDSQDNLVSQIFSLATATQSQASQPSISVFKQEIIIPSSLDEEVELAPMPPKRFQSETPPSLPPPKKIKREIPSSDSKKRKGDGDSFVQAPLSKKSSIQENPFTSIKRKTVTNVDNPFGKIGIIREPKIDNNPFIIQRNQERSKEVNEIEVISQESDTTDSCALSQDVSTSSAQWLSKSDIKDEDLKVADEEFREIFEAFKNKVVVEIIPLIPRNKPLEDVKNVFAGKKNFKKFKKVKPLRPQTRIITTATYLDNKDSLVLKQEQEEEIAHDEEIDEPPLNRSRIKKEMNITSRFVF